MASSAIRRSSARRCVTHQDGAFSATRNVSAVAGPTVVVRQVTMPVMSERELRESTKYEAERFLPYSVDEAQIDAKILGHD